MITPLFSQRYKDSFFLLNSVPPSCAQKILTQLSSIFHEDIFPLLRNDYLMQMIHAKSEKLFTREMGWEKFSYMDNSPEYRCKRFILDKNQTWHVRLSLIEILLREFHIWFKPEAILRNETKGYKDVFGSGKSEQEISNDLRKSYEDAIDEINDRLAAAEIRIFYQNGYFMPIEDNLTADLIEKPFWNYIKNKPDYESIEAEMLEAVEAYYKYSFNEACRKAFMAFESALKVTIDNSDNSTFANLVDNTPEEKINIPIGKDYLKALNSKYRNSNSHGAGNKKRKQNSKEDAEFCIGVCMLYIKYVLSMNNRHI